MTHSRKPAHEMFPLVERYLDGHKTQKDFCRAHDISTSKLCYWLAKYRRETAERPSAFLEITPPTPPEAAALLEVVYPHGVRLRVFSLVEPAYLARLLALEDR